MSRDERQDLSKYKTAGEDLPSRGKGVVEIEIKDRGPKDMTDIFKDGKRPRGWTGKHRADGRG